MSISSSFPSISPSLNLDFAKSKSLDPRITFTRAQTGNIATYTGSDGLIKYAGPNAPRFDHKQTFRTNLLTYSEQMDQKGQVEVNVTTNVISAPDGSSTADLIQETTSNNQHNIQQGAATVVGGLHTVSVYAKAYSSNRVLRMATYKVDNPVGTDTAYLFNLNTGVATFVGGVSGGMEYAGDGWYRCYVTTGNINAGTGVYFGIAETNGVFIYIGDGSSGFYLWGAQLEASDAPTAYIATGPSAVTRTATESLGLLIEESRTNLVTYSQDFTQSIWQSASNRATCDNTTGIDDPSGGTTASRWSSGTSAGQELIYRQTGTSAGTLTGETCTKSIWIRRVSNDGSVSFFLGDNVGNVVNSQLDSVPVGTWVRCSITRTIVGNNGDTRNYIAVYPGTNGQPTTIDIWGDQFEIGSFPTSYIPTSGSSVTRPVDSCGIAASQMSGWFNSDNFSMTIEAESSGSTPGVGRAIWGISDGGSFNNSMYLTLPENNNTVTLSMVTGGTGQGTLAFDSVFDKNTVYNLGFGVANADRVTVNGGAVTNSISSGTLASEYNQFNIGSGWSLGAARQGRATISKLTYYPKRITNSQLQILTK